ncbi:3-carboxy-cis,cis-muconate cycloisomerase, partial [Streptomyces sp. SID8361]|nr:3-carboxy-cis,cis-muconate cycloisomerase [Streptomyces sp. SID8361]
PLVADLTAAVARTDREAASYVHRGATSQDIVDTAAMLVAARALPLIVADLERTAAELARLAAAHRDTPMPGRTLTQHAVPTTFGLKAAGWRALVLDARDRLAALRPPAQLGGAAGTLAAFEAGFGA